jgi:hypothetical protein
MIIKTLLLNQKRFIRFFKRIKKRRKSAKINFSKLKNRVRKCSKFKNKRGVLLLFLPNKMIKKSLFEFQKGFTNMLGKFIF